MLLKVRNHSVSWSWDECCAYHVLVLLVSPVGSVLTDPGPLCAGRTVVLNCTGGQAHGWMYDMSREVNINVLQEPPTEPVELSGVQFTFSQLSPSPNLITQISFMSSQEIDGKILTCLSVIDLSTIVTGEVTLTISENNSKSSIITIELYMTKMEASSFVIMSSFPRMVVSSI